MWFVSGKSTDAAHFRPFEPVEVLYDFDGPRSFTLRDADGDLLFAHWCDEDDQAERYLVVPFMQKLVDRLKAGMLTLRDALDQPRVWVVDVKRSGEVATAWRIQFTDLPPDILPHPGTMLLPSLEPLISLRAVGTQITEGRIPSSIVKALVDGVQHAVKVLTEFAMNLTPQAGRPAGALKRLFDLPAQRFAFNSIEIAFRSPLADQPNLFADLQDEVAQAEKQAFEKVGQLLRSGLEWATSTTDVVAGTTAEEQRVILQAVKDLTPSSQSGIKTLEIRGTLLGRFDRPVVLNSEARRRVNKSLKQLPSAQREKVVTYTGRIRELDKDKRSFELREIEDEAVEMQRFTFDEELAEDVLEAFHDNLRAIAVGTPYPISNVAQLAALTKLESNSGDETA